MPASVAPGFRISEYELSRGYGRQITREEAKAILRRSVEEGAVLQTVSNKTSAAICSCHGNVCGFLRTLKALGDAYPSCATAPYVGHYYLRYDPEACIGCGTCAERCPMTTITMNEEGRPEIGPSCVGCGQCAYVCPVEARKLAMKDDSDFPEDFLDDQNQKAEFRFRNGLII